MRGLVLSVRFCGSGLKEIEIIESNGGVDAPDERGEIGKDVSTQTVLLDDQEGRGRYNLGAFIMSRACQASDVLTY